MFRHKHHDNEFTIQGCSEVFHIYNKIKPLIEQDENNASAPRPIFREKPHFAWDDFFSGAPVMELAASEGFGLTTTCRKDRLPKKVPGYYWHKVPTGTSERSKVARFEQPIVAVKKYGDSYFQYTSFQSTGPTNLPPSTPYMKYHCALNQEKEDVETKRDNGQLR